MFNGVKEGRWCRAGRDARRDFEGTHGMSRDVRVARVLRDRVEKDD